jgi:Zn-dependent protease
MGELSQLIPPWTKLLIIPGILAGFTVHELGHTFVAYLLGDLSQVERGRITLNPFRHISWFGTFTFVLFGFGWARPIQVDPGQFKRRSVCMFLVAISGAAANLLLAGLVLALTLMLVTMVSLFSQQDLGQVLGLLLYVEPDASPNIAAWTAAFTTYTVYANLALAFFNLIPFPTLDGFTALVSLIRMLRVQEDEEVETPAGRRASAKDSAPSYRGTSSRGGASARSGGSQRQPADIHFELGAQFHAEGQHQDAIARYRQAIANDRHYGPAYVNLGLAYLALDQRSRAIQAFRGATRYATDEKSKTEAWSQLHKLSEYRPLIIPDTLPVPEEDIAQDAPETGPWTDTRPTPNWLAFGLSSFLALVSAGCLYIYLAISLVQFLSS